MNSRVSIVRCADYDTEKIMLSVKQAVGHLGGMGRFVKKGDRVLLKPNLLSARPPEAAVTTHPEVVRAVIRLVKEAGGIPSVGDSPGGSITNDEPLKLFKSLEKLWSATGMRKVCDEENAELVSFETGGAKVFEIKGRKRTPLMSISKTVLSADVVINLPKLKTHALTLYTGAIKNLFGCVPGLRKVRYHAQAVNAEDFSLMLCDILSLVMPKLTIIDAVTAMDGNGPNTGRIINPGLVLAGEDCVSLDTAGARILGFGKGEVPAVRLAGSMGLGESDPAKISVLGEKLEDVAVKKPLKPTPAPSLFLRAVPGFVGNIAANFIWMYPFIDDSKCTVCKECLKSCPAGAISMAGKFPVVDRKKCISCMCCHELCSFSAIKIKKSLLMNIMTKARGR